MPIDLWIEALRSGKYEQGQMALNKNGKYCCLGVACEVYQQEVGDLDIKIRDDGLVSYNKALRLLPIKVEDWLGLSNCSGDFGFKSLSQLNDSDYSFEEIADIIESRPPGLFLE